MLGGLILVGGITDFVGEKAARVEGNAQRLHLGQGDDHLREEKRWKYLRKQTNDRKNLQPGNEQETKVLKL